MDAGTKTLHRKISTLPCKWAGPGKRADCGLYSYGISNPYGFGWAAKGFTQDPKSALAARAVLTVNPWLREPDTRNGTDHPDCGLMCAPVPLKATLTATGLRVGTVYEIYRWDSVTTAFTCEWHFPACSIWPRNSGRELLHCFIQSFVLMPYCKCCRYRRVQEDALHSYCGQACVF